MSPKHLIYLASFIIFLSGCGLEPDEEEAEEEERVAATIVVDQNPFLPLTVGTSIIYTDGATAVTSSVSKNTTLSDDDATVYDLTMTDEGSETLVLQVESNSDAIMLEGIDGSLIPTAVNRILFDSPIELTKDQKDVKATILAKVASGLLTIPVPITYSITVTKSFPFDSNDDDYGILPGKKINFSGLIEVSDAENSLTDINLEIELVLSIGIGIVSQTVVLDGTNTIVNHEIESLVNSPLTVWFDHNAGSPILDAGKPNNDGVFKYRPTASDPVENMTTSLFNIANESELEGTGWIDISINSAGSYVVGLKSNSNLPSSELVSKQVIFNGTDGKQYSGSIVLKNL